jgi:thiol-disulfide isomerase/thioredoxin
MDGVSRPESKLRPAWLNTLLFGVIVLLAVMVWQRYLRTSSGLVGSAAREVPTDGVWINADKPESLASLRGRVVLMQFSFIGCGYCRKMDPYLSKWHDQFMDEGLSIVEVDDGRIDSLADVQGWATGERISYSVFYDTSGKLTDSYGVQSYPTLLLVGRDGKIVWQDHGWRGEAGIQQLEGEIKKALAAK